MKYSLTLFTLMLVFFFTACNDKKDDIKTAELYCYIKSFEQRNDKFFITVDLIDFFSGEQALEEALKDNNAAYDINENGDTSFYIPDNYYIRNGEEIVKTYEIADTAKIFVVKYTDSGLSREEISCNNYYLRKQHLEILKLTISDKTVCRIDEIFVP